jgi:phosphoenolpyruvate---glycerone phosphotransferase subunit DhaL
MTRDEVVEWIRRYAAAIAEQKQYLTDLDAAIGDGDHGINMDRGMSEVCAKLDGLADRDVGAILNAVGMTLLSKVGGAAGPLYGTLFMRFSKETAGKLELTGPEFAAALEAGLTGIQQRGSARRGEKTMVDALAPAVDALRQALDRGDALPAALREAASASRTGAELTIPMQATKGRASYLGPRSVGHKDPGATSAQLLIETAAAAASATTTAAAADS